MHIKNMLELLRECCNWLRSRTCFTDSSSPLLSSPLLLGCWLTCRYCMLLNLPTVADTHSRCGSRETKWKWHTDNRQHQSVSHEAWVSLLSHDCTFILYICNTYIAWLWIALLFLQVVTPCLTIIIIYCQYTYIFINIHTGRACSLIRTVFAHFEDALWSFQIRNDNEQNDFNYKLNVFFLEGGARKVLSVASTPAACSSRC